jgi:hypothetical protein
MRHVNLVGGEGVEPSWPCDRRILSPVRLPIPPLAHQIHITPHMLRHEGWLGKGS